MLSIRTATTKDVPLLAGMAKTRDVKLTLIKETQHAEFPSCPRFSFTRNKLEKSRKPSSPACACLWHDWYGNRGNPCQSWYVPPRKEYCFRPNISWQRPFNAYFLFIVRWRNSCISDPIRSTSSSNAKWPVSRRWSSAVGISLFKSSAPSTVKIPSFLPHVISVGG